MYEKSVDNTSPSIPTLYRGIQMRSQLEAKWAYMFDAFGWKWEYEPIVLDGWIPDFVIKTHSVPLLVDIKPIFAPDEAVQKKIENAIGTENVGQKYDALIIGARMWQGEYEQSLFGWIAQADPDPDHPTPGCFWDEAAIICFHGVYDIGSFYMSYAGRITNCYDGNFHGAARWDLGRYWAAATNMVQWRAPKVRK